MSIKKSDKLRVLFVCTGNIFRSAFAEKYFNKIAGKHMIASSSGIRARPQKMYHVTEESLRKVKCTISHTQRKLTQKIVEDADVIVCFAQYHRDFVKRQFNADSWLFNELAINKATDVQDNAEFFGIAQSKTNEDQLAKFCQKTLHYIAKHMPALIDAIELRYFLFSEFVKGNREERDGLPYIELAKNKHAVAFMSRDIPLSQDSHVLVIPKKRYIAFHDIPDDVMSDCMKLTKKIGVAMLKTHAGYNVIQNNGSAAGQYVFHAHFHVVPRDSGDGIKIEYWGRPKKITKADFVKKNKAFLKLMQK